MVAANKFKLFAAVSMQQIRRSRMGLIEAEDLHGS
jgi:hypothetical protein